MSSDFSGIWPWVATIGLAVVTVVTRAFFMIPEREVPMPEWFKRGLKYAPLAALAAVIAPELLMSQGALIGTLADARLPAALCATLYFFWKRGILGTIVVGMAVKFWMLCRDGQVWDAVWDVGTWWVIFAGIGLFALNLTGVSSVGSVAGIPVVLVLGCLMLLAQGRSAKGFGKVTAVIGAVYNGVTGYFGDILSYSRLMVMMLAGSVIGQVFNILGAMPGGGLPPAVGIPIFFVIFIVGHAFNIGLNVIGTYVHTSRLQYLEFFKQFYKEGGRPWRPLNIATKFVDIKEEQ